MGEMDRKPEWLKVRLRNGTNFRDVRRLLQGLELHTVCEEARCPNIFECWEQRTATFMILGDICTRACRFCAVTSGHPTGLDLAEPERVAEAVERLKLRHVVVTSVARDDLADGGAGIFARTIEAIRERWPACTIEVLTPDFAGQRSALETVLWARPDVLNHNIETVQRLTPRVRSRFTYARSLEYLRRAKGAAPQLLTKSGMMLGLGEEQPEVLATLRDLREAGVDLVTIGQYLRPSTHHLPVTRYIPPDEFRAIREEAMLMGFRHVEAGPLVRSSYHAGQQVEAARRKEGNPDLSRAARGV